MTAGFKDRAHTILCYAIHVVTIVAALALVALNHKQYYIDGELSGPDREDTDRFGVLLFAAKLHEFLMLASLGTIVLTCFHRGFVHASSVGVENDSISRLCSPASLMIIGYEWKRN